MGKRDSRRSLKMRQRKAQAAKKARLAKRKTAHASPKAGTAAAATPKRTRAPKAAPAAAPPPSNPGSAE